MSRSVLRAATAAFTVAIIGNATLILAVVVGARALQRRTHPTYSAVTARPGRTVRRPVDDAA